MHVLLGLIVAAVVAYVIYRMFFVHAPVPVGASSARSDRGFAFLSNGLLFYRQRGGEAQQLHSPYAQESIDRRERARERHSWKEGTSFNISAGGGMRSFEVSDQPVMATSAAFEADGSLLYFLKDENIGGLFRREPASGRELRVLLRQNLHLADLTVSPDGTLLAATSYQPSGVANIALLKSDGSNYREVTGGDTVDSAPAWIPDAPKRLLFQSSGFARNEQGHIIARGPASVQMLDLESGSVSPVLEDAQFDHLKPRISPEGDLLFIRRPFDAPHYGMGKALADALLFPFRLLRAVFHWLNFFSLMYTRKPLTSASGPAMQADIKTILLQGRRIDAEKALRRERPVQGVPSLVPDSWQLITRNREGIERVLATNVASFDMSSDGTIVYSNGRGVFVLEQNGLPRLALSGELVADVFAASV